MASGGVTKSSGSAKPNDAWPDLAYVGSVKDIYGPDESGNLIFRFSDRYSIFDWGEMPDSLPDKGNALAVMADLFFRLLKQEGIDSHSIGLIGEKLRNLTPGSAARNLYVAAVPVVKPKQIPNSERLSFDYSHYHSRPTEGLVPLEVIFRFGVPAGSSLLTRVEQDPNYAKELGIGADLKAGEWLPEPLVEFSTKLEPTDRILTLKQAAEVAGLNADEMNALKLAALTGANTLSDIFKTLGLELWDGKFEFAFQDTGAANRGFLLVDSIGPDELRLLSSGTQISKEYLRQHYRGSSWEVAVRKAKSLAEERGVIDWKQICRDELGETPQPLPVELRDTVADMYRSMANKLADIAGAEPPFPDTQELEFVIKKLKQLEEPKP